MKRFLLALIGLCLMVSAQDEVADITFRQGKTALPEGWVLSAAAKPENCSFKDGIVTLSGYSVGNVYLYRPKLNLRKNVSYEFTCEAKCQPGGDYMIYYEYWNEGGYVSNIRRLKGDGKWRTVSVHAAREVDTRDERVMLRTMNSTVLEIRNVKIVEMNNDHGVRDSFPPAAAKTRFLHNGSFEWGDEYWTLLGNAQVVRSDEDLGNRALLLRPGAMAAQQSIHLLPNRKYILSWYTRIDKVADAKSEEAALQVAVRYMPSKEILNETPQAVRPLPDTYFNAYYRSSFEFTTPAGKPVIDVILRNAGKVDLRATQIYLHETVLRDVENVPGLSLRNYRDAVFSTSPYKSFTGSVKQESTVCLKDKEGKVLAKVQAKPQGNPFHLPEHLANPSFTFDAVNLPFGDYTIEATTKAGASYAISAHKYPPLKGEVVLDGSSNILVDGEKFFPFFMLKLFEDPKKNVMTYLCARNGMTGIFGGGVASEVSALAVLDKAQRFGLKVILWLPGDFAMEDNYAEKLETFLKKVLTPKVVTHPALFAYNYCDEPWAREIPPYKFEPCSEIFRRLDPYHPLFINESPRGVVPENLYDYARWADIYGVDLYPLPAVIRHSVLADKSMAAVGLYSEIYRAASRNCCPVLMWLQGYQWLPDGDANAVLPTPSQHKFMCMDALLHGTKAIAIFNSRTNKQDFYNDSFPAFAEVARLEQIIRLGKKVPEPPHQPGLYMRAYKLDGQQFLFILNETAKAVPVDHAALGKYALAWSSEPITGSLPPYSVALYSSDGAMPPPLKPLTPLQPELEAEAQDYIKQYYNRAFPKPPLSETEWIWYPGLSGSACSLTLKRDVNLPKTPTQVHIQTTVDNIYSLYIDDKLVGSSSEWNIITRYDVTEYFTPGTHKIRMECKNLDGPAGLFLLLTATYEDGTQTILKTDNTWELINSAGIPAKAESFGKVGAARTWDWTNFMYHEVKGKK